jgi:hypothetical protein
MKIWLFVPFEDRDFVKALGAKFCGKKRQWYAENPEIPELFDNWLKYPEIAKKKKQTKLSAGADLYEFRRKEQEDLREYAREQKALKEHNNRILVKPKESNPGVKTIRRVKKDGTIVE